MTKIDNLKEQLEKIQQELLDLDAFRDTPFLRKFRRQLQGESSEIKAKIVSLPKLKNKKQSNIKRS
jgi:hypothetical protein